MRREEDDRRRSSKSSWGRSLHWQGLAERHSYGQEIRYVRGSKINVFSILRDNINDTNANEKEILNDFVNF